MDDIAPQAMTCLSCRAQWNAAPDALFAGQTGSCPFCGVLIANDETDEEAA